MITSLQNTNIKHIIKLKKKSERQALNESIIDGGKAIFTAIKFNVNILGIYYFISSENSENKHLIETANAKKIPLIEVSKQVFQKMSYGDIDEGFIAHIKTENMSLNELKIENNPLFIILENVEKPGNIGAILRTSDALKCSGVIVCDPLTDLYNPNIIRSSRGACFCVPYVSADKNEVKNFLKANNIQCVTLTPDGKNIYLDHNFKIPVAILAGNEHKGVSPDFKNEDIQTLYIPMLGEMDSLNVSVAITVVLYECFRQRRNL
ncbi:MAG: hypothetical protein ACD_79C00739G0016 [uncultured bacterium]|nr:MAG: hypothetical protein ACD_79C00739G0016 [uncultured bacterium]